MALGLIPWIPMQFFDADGHPLSGGKLFTYEAGGVIPQATYSDASGAAPSVNPNPIELDVDGRPPDSIFVLPTGYHYVVTDADDVPLYDVDDVSDPGTVFAANMGTILFAGQKDISDGALMVATDRLVTTDAAETTDPSTFQLLAAADVTMPLTFKNFSAVVWSLEPDGADTIEGIAAAYDVPAAASPNFPAVTLYSDGVSGWQIVSSHGL